MVVIKKKLLYIKFHFFNNIIYGEDMVKSNEMKNFLASMWCEQCNDDDDDDDTMTLQAIQAYYLSS